VCVCVYYLKLKLPLSKNILISLYKLDFSSKIQKKWFLSIVNYCSWNGGDGWMGGNSINNKLDLSTNLEYV